MKGTKKRTLSERGFADVMWVVVLPILLAAAVTTVFVGIRYELEFPGAMGAFLILAMAYYVGFVIAAVFWMVIRDGVKAIRGNREVPDKSPNKKGVGAFESLDSNRADESIKPQG